MFENKYLLMVDKRTLPKSPEARKKISESVKKTMTPERRKQLSEQRKGKWSGENNPNFGKHLTGESNPFFGKKHSDETKKLMSEKLTGIPRHLNQGELNYQWKGDDASYTAKHVWVRKLKPQPDLCELCKTRRSCDLHCYDKTYPRENLDLWVWICRKCHVELEPRAKRKT